MWRKYVKYPMCLTGETKSTLDALSELVEIVPCEYGNDLTISGWLRRGVESGVITNREKDHLMSDLAPNL